MSGAGDVVVTLGTTEGQSIVEPRTIRLEVEGDGLVATNSVTGSTLRFSPGILTGTAAVEPTPAAQAEPSEEASTGQSFTFVSTQPAADSPALTRSLTINEDGTVTLVSDYHNDQPAIVEEGTWAANEDGTLTVTLTGQAGGQTYLAPVVITFAIDGNTLSAVDYDTSIYGSQGLTMELEEPAAGASSETPAATAAPTEGSDALARTYLTLGRQPNGEPILRSMAFFPDGTVTFTSDYYNDKPLIVEDGVFTENEDATVTVTLTGQNGQDYLTPDVITFAADGDALTAVEYDQSKYGSNGLNMQLAAGVALDEKAALVTIDLQAGFPLDPTFVSVNAGGDLNSAVIDADCAGYINTQPVVTVNWTGEAELVEVFFVSNDDPTLVIVGPDGAIYCSDDANDQLLDPVIELQNPMEGQYRIWAGSYARGQLIPGVLVMTANPDVNIGTFDLGSFIQRPLVPEVLEAPAPAVDMESIQAEIEARIAKTQLQKLGAPAGSVEITAEGTIPLFQLELDNPTCNGLVAENPDHVFDWSGAAELLNVYFEGDSDATLLVLGPDKSVACSDDSAETGNVNPQVIVSNPVAGTYAVWIGRINPESPVAGTLFITTDGSAVPAMLEADQ